METRRASRVDKQSTMLPAAQELAIGTTRQSRTLCHSTYWTALQLTANERTGLFLCAGATLTEVFLFKKKAGESHAAAACVTASLHCRSQAASSHVFDASEYRDRKCRRLLHFVAHDRAELSGRLDFSLPFLPLSPTSRALTAPCACRVVPCQRTLRTVATQY